MEERLHNVTYHGVLPLRVHRRRLNQKMQEVQMLPMGSSHGLIDIVTLVSQT
ncbi:unnamed protein product, partial [Trichogramma brassicae]